MEHVIQNSRFWYLILSTAKLLGVIARESYIFGDYRRADYIWHNQEGLVNEILEDFTSMMPSKR